MDANEDAAVQDFLEILEEHRKNCERQGKYVEAEIAKNRLDELKLHEENRRRVRKYIHLQKREFLQTCFPTTAGGNAIAPNRREIGRRRSSYA